MFYIGTVWLWRQLLSPVLGIEFLVAGLFCNRDRPRFQHRTQQYENRLEFLDRNEKRFNWDNAQLIESEGLVEQALGPHPGLPNEIPGVGIGVDTGAKGTAVTPEPTQDIINNVKLSHS